MPAKKTTKATTTKKATEKKVSTKKTPVRSSTKKQVKGNNFVGSFVLQTIFAAIISAGVVLAVLPSQEVQVQEPQDLTAAIEKGIEDYVAKQQQDQANQAIEAEKEREQKVQAVRLPDETDYIRGNPDAPVTILEYSDYECPFCKRNHPVVSRLMDTYGDNVNWVYRHNPLPFHDPNATDQAEAAECVAELNGGDAFWLFSDLLYERTESNKSFEFAWIQPLAEEIGVDGAAFEECMNSDRYLAKVQQHTQEAQSMDLTGTPANLIINNETGEVRLLGGAYPYESFTAIIDGMIQ